MIREPGLTRTCNMKHGLFDVCARFRSFAMSVRDSGRSRITIRSYRYLDNTQGAYPGAENTHRNPRL